MSLVTTTPAGEQGTEHERATRPGISPPRIGLLGGFTITRGAAVGIMPLAAQRVIAFVALQRRPVHRGYVAGQLWLDASEERACASLRTALWRARLPGTPLLSATATHIGLAAGVRLDVDDVVSAARGVLRDRDETAAVPDCLLDSEDLLPDWYDDWLIIERERVRQLRRLALETLCECLTDSGRHREAAEVGLAAIAAEPLRESAHRALIAAYLAEGNVIDALRQYRVLVLLLRRQLDAAPSQATRSLLARAKVVTRA